MVADMELEKTECAGLEGLDGAKDFTPRVQASSHHTVACSRPLGFHSSPPPLKRSEPVPSGPLPVPPKAPTASPGLTSSKALPGGPANQRKQPVVAASKQTTATNDGDLSWFESIAYGPMDQRGQGEAESNAGCIFIFIIFIFIISIFYFSLLFFIFYLFFPGIVHIALHRIASHRITLHCMARH